MRLLVNIILSCFTQIYAQNKTDEKQFLCNFLYFFVKFSWDISEKKLNLEPFWSVGTFILSHIVI